MNRTKRSREGILYGILAAAIFLILVILVVVLTSGDEPSETTATTTEAVVTTTGPIETTTENSTTARTTYPPATVPGTTVTTESHSPITPAARTITPLTNALKEKLMALDNTLLAWGIGPHYDANNRPIDATKAQEKYGKYNSVYVTEGKNFYLTFDEGYENGYTEKILDVLKEKDVQAVFFITMSYAKNNEALVRRMIDEGHAVGNHSTAHLSFPSMTLEDAYADIKGLHDYVLETFDYEMSLFRFPMGESSERTQALVREMGYTSLFWSFAYRDFETDNQPDPAESLTLVKNRTHEGALYLLHAVSDTNTKILPDYIDWLRAEGYTISRYPEN